MGELFLINDNQRQPRQILHNGPKGLKERYSFLSDTLKYLAQSACILSAIPNQNFISHLEKFEFDHE